MSLCVQTTYEIKHTCVTKNMKWFSIQSINYEVTAVILSYYLLTNRRTYGHSGSLKQLRCWQKWRNCFFSEEILESGRAMWVSPASSQASSPHLLAYLSFQDARVRNHFINGFYGVDQVPRFFEHLSISCNSQICKGLISQFCCYSLSNNWQDIFFSSFEC